MQFKEFITLGLQALATNLKKIVNYFNDQYSTSEDCDYRLNYLFSFGE